MSKHRPIWLALAGLALVTFVSQACAAERNYWRHSKGHFENVKGNNWQEKAEEGTFYFVETRRTDRFVELYDKKREVTVRLFDDRCMVKGPDKDKFEYYYDGKWQK